MVHSVSDDPEVNDVASVSSAQTWPPLVRFVDLDRRIASWSSRRASTAVVYEFVRFGVKQAWACLFGALMVCLLIGSFLLYPKDASLARYDFIVIASVLIQIGLIALKLETIDEAKVILIFHLVGTGMEVFKTATGSWVYPETNLLRIAGVPLFTGFMYASIGSYMARAWRLFDFHFTAYPPIWQTIALSTAIYVNFFTDHYDFDFRMVLFAAFVAIYGRTWIHYKIHTSYRKMPILVSTALVAVFIWLAENIGTITKAWIYPNQKHAWEMVSVSKLGSWYLLTIISAVLVSLVNRPKPMSSVVIMSRKAQPVAWIEEPWHSQHRR